MATSASLVTLGEKTLPHAADPSLFAYCPSMDLVALGTTDQQVLIYRLNGQRVYGAAQKAGKLAVESIRWKPNGQLLAVAWSDGTVRLVGAESSKIVHQFSTGEGVSGITCMGWGSNLTSKTSSLKESSSSWSDLLDSDTLVSETKSVLDLPRDLSMIDIERSLPKLSLLAAGGSSEDVFCSRSSLDTLFRPFDPKDNDAVDVMVVGTKEGHIHLTIYDSFVIGSFSLPPIRSSFTSHLVMHSSHPRCSSHALLVKAPDSDSLSFAALDLRFISATSDYLSLLASRSTALQNLLRYIHQVQILIVNEWKSTRDLPSKFLRNVNEELADKGKGNIVQALYHSVATGHTFPIVKEWLVDELSERGHKRWEKAVVTGLENTRRLVHENMLPALERCSVILSRFSGIAKFQSSNDTLGFSSHQISLIVDTVACLHLVSAKILLQVVDELELFGAFSSWLRHEIDKLASDSSVAAKDDDLEKEASIEHSKVLLYLQNCMTSSPLEVYLGDNTSDEYKNGWQQVEENLPIYEILDKQLRKQESGLPYLKALPRVELLCNYLNKQAKVVFSQIANAEKRNVIFGTPQQVGVIADEKLIDMRLSTTGPATARACVAFVPKNMPACIQITRVHLSIDGGLSSVSEMDSSTLKLGSGTITDVKIFGDTLLIMWELDGATTLLTIPHDTSTTPHATEPGDFRIHYSPHLETSTTPTPVVLTNEDVKERFGKCQIPTTGSFVPERMEVRSGSLEMRRIAVLGKDRIHYKVLGLEMEEKGKGNGKSKGSGGDVEMVAEV
ncbi:hypothetical protein HYFRA_00007078 [Hymenoscyphus fraxineus]|uniref:Anaphase-promoting complex subunit 4 n=1 Tax=Hymenoscyphus fraxineus TaxID=746836 RepID=A0A9N9KWB4_9HELO|nr:hypothetical protein HYFRA_00007078 [Hymenoscyphus fraxineus]